MPDPFPDARVLVAAMSDSATDGSEPDRASEEASRVAADIHEELGAETVVKRSRTAFEYVREFAPLLDCVVCLADDVAGPTALADVDPALPLVVYGDASDDPPVDSVVRRDGGTDTLVARVADRVTRNVERNRLAEANTKLTTLNAYTQGITACETREEVVDRVVDAVTEVLAYDHCVLGLARGDRLVAHGNTTPDIDVEWVGVDEGVIGRTFHTGETTITDDYHSDPDRRHTNPRIQSIVSVPLDDHGVLQVTAPEPAAFDERDAEFLEIVAAHATEAFSRLEREAALRTERDRLHAFFDGLCAPAVYVESEWGDEPVVREVNPAYEATFPAAPVGDPVESAFPTDVERRLFGEAVRGNDTVTETLRRDTVDATDASMTVTLVPVRTAGIAAAGFGVYVADVTLP